MTVEKNFWIKNSTVQCPVEWQLYLKVHLRRKWVILLFHIIVYRTKNAFNCIYQLAQNWSTFICLENVLFSVNSQFTHTLRIENTTHTRKVVQPDAVRWMQAKYANQTFAQNHLFKRGCSDCSSFNTIMHGTCIQKHFKAFDFIVFNSLHLQ